MLLNPNQTNQHHELQVREPHLCGYEICRSFHDLSSSLTQEPQECQALPNTGKFHISEHMTLGYHCEVNNAALLCSSSQEGNASCYPSLQSEELFFLKHGQTGNSVQSLSQTEFEVSLN